MLEVHGIIVHQTAAPTLASTMESYRDRKSAGSHFVIDRDGTIYQTASLYQSTWHVGKLRSRCHAEKRCSPSEFKDRRASSVDKREQLKEVPDRYPANRDSIAIELVGDALPHPTVKKERERVFEVVTAAQNNSLKWLVAGLISALHVPPQEIFRHPVVSAKTDSEASTARW